ncbi:hypothetical protein DRK59_24030 [Salmonella enterica subsp. diarizonae]|uniref:Uncharacterized protein n=1 Tax=Citrobacter braakii TaxID=57706 RepID=A0A1V8P438_CITBR|nr:hypothetical protein [Salmonella enterica]EBY8711584.1 hypothetical protein [Salmonella enterica subsp. enterica serovar Kottbus]EDU8162101.1 hypothetical protein [Salmonella enterica subsp. diarizonae]OQM43455.1 hypothetical protein BZK42_00710 [Citrobacter braakii]EAQ6114546.1 hypothetical protein [Salmonella enterica]
MLKKTQFFKKSGYQAEILPLRIFRWLMLTMQAVCIVVFLVGTFEVVLNNIGEPGEGPFDTIIRNECSY